MAFTQKSMCYSADACFWGVSEPHCETLSVQQWPEQHTANEPYHRVSNFIFLSYYVYIFNFKYVYICWPAASVHPSFNQLSRRMSFFCSLKISQNRQYSLTHPNSSWEQVCLPFAVCASPSVLLHSGIMALLFGILHMSIDVAET